MKKYDLFVSSLKVQCPIENQKIEEAALIIQKAYRAHLERIGFTDVDVNCMRHVEVRDLTQQEIDDLNRQPFYISEHFITRTYHLDAMEEPKVPFRVRPGLGKYSYVHGGKRAQNSWAVQGNVNGGKTCLIHELTKVIKQMVPGAVVVLCDNEFTDERNFDVTTDEDAYREYRDNIKSKPIAIGIGPIYRTNADWSVVTNVNI